MNFKLFFVTIAILIVTCESSAQVDSLWSHTYGGSRDDYCQTLIQTADGGYAIAGHAYSFGAGGNDFWLVKTNPDGDSLWSRTYGGESYENCSSLIQTEDGGFAMAGMTQSFGAGASDFWLVKTNSDGDSLWSRTFGREGIDACYSLVQTSDGGFALAGVTYFQGVDNPDFWLVRTNSDGDSLWSRTFDGGNVDACQSFIQTADGGFAMTGITLSFGPGDRYDSWLIRTDENGDSLWSQTYDGAQFKSLIETTDEGFAIAGSFINGDFLLVKTDSDGDSLWSNTFGGGENDNCVSIVQTADSGFALAGYTSSFGDGNYAFWLVKTDEHGDSLWSRTFGGGAYDICNSMILTDDGGFALAGHTSSSGAGGSDFWLVKTGPDPVSVSDGFISQPSSFILSPAFPNPFNGTTRVNFSVGPMNREATSLRVYDPAGRLVEDLIPNGGFGNPPYAGGMHSVTWNGAGKASGNYFVRLQAGGQVLQQPIVLVK